MSRPMTPRAQEASIGFLKVIREFGTDESESLDALLLGLATYLNSREKYFGSELAEISRTALIDRLDEFVKFIKERPLV